MAVNRRAFHDYFVDERFEAGLVLLGSEVKSLRGGKCNLRDGYVHLVQNQAWMENVHISPYAQAGLNHEPTRSRKLLLHKDEIASLIGRVRQKGYTLVPLRVYFARNRAKVEVGLCRGKREYDKRQTIAAADAKREMERAVRH